MHLASSTYRKNWVFEGKQPEKPVFEQKRGLDYYPFGMMVPGRHYTSGTSFQN
jgi:hypothetical protein